jgi:DNA polymerase V
MINHQVNAMGLSANVDALYTVDNGVKLSLPFYASVVNAGATGFPSPADDYMEAPLDLNSYFNSKPHATFYVRARGDSMTQAGIADNDVLVVDRSLKARNGDVVICIHDGELLVKILRIHLASVTLNSANAKYPPVEVGNPESLVIWGVVTGIIKKLMRR